MLEESRAGAESASRGFEFRRVGSSRNYSAPVRLSDELGSLLNWIQIEASNKATS
jgi:hypothetical protein